MDTCPACGGGLGDAHDVCPECGAALSERTESFDPVGEGMTARELSEIDAGPLLAVRKGPEVGERFYIDRSRLVLGRDPASDIFLNDITVSRRHAVLDFEAGQVTVEDAGSLNGTYVNGVSVDRATLRNGDELQIGRFRMVFLDGGGA